MTHEGGLGSEAIDGGNDYSVVFLTLIEASGKSLHI